MTNINDNDTILAAPLDTRVHLRPSLTKQHENAAVAGDPPSRCRRPAAYDQQHGGT